MIPTTITTDDSLGIIYTTVIQFAYLMDGDEGNYTCTVAIQEVLAESTYYLGLISKHKLGYYMYMGRDMYVHCNQYKQNYLYLTYIYTYQQH